MCGPKSFLSNELGGKRAVALARAFGVGWVRIACHSRVLLTPKLRVETRWSERVCAEWAEDYLYDTVPAFRREGRSRREACHLKDGSKARLRSWSAGCGTLY